MQNLINNYKKMPDQARDKAVAFICGDLLVMIFYILGFVGEIAALGLKIAVALVLGVVGGIAGMLGKDVYTWGKKKLNKNERV